MTYAFEPELRGAIPRTVARRKEHGSLLGVPLAFVLPHTLIGLGLIGGVVFLSLFIGLGTERTARVVSVTQSTYKGRPSWQLTYEYENDGRRFEGHGAYSAPPPFAPTAPFPVHAFNLGPLEQSQPVDQFTPFVLFGAIAFCLFWNGILFTFHYNFWIRPLRWRRLVREGQPHRALLTSKREFGGRGKSWLVHYRYELDLQSFEGKMTVRKEDFATAEVGAAVTVLVNPERPKQSVLYAYCPWKVIG